MNDELMMRLAMIQRYCPAAEAEALQPLLADITLRVQGVTAFAVSEFSPTLLPATAWVSPLHAPTAHLLRAGD